MNKLFIERFFNFINGLHNLTGNYNNALALKKKNPNLKVLIAIGGYNAGSQVFSNMTLTAERRQTFIARYK